MNVCLSACLVANHCFVHGVAIALREIAANARFVRANGG